MDMDKIRASVVVFAVSLLYELLLTIIRQASTMIPSVGLALVILFLSRHESIPLLMPHLCCSCCHAGLFASFPSPFLFLLAFCLPPFYCLTKNKLG